MCLLFIYTEGEDSDIDFAIDILSDLAKEESEKGEDQELFFFYGADVSIFQHTHLLSRPPSVCLLVQAYCNYFKGEGQELFFSGDQIPTSVGQFQVK